MNMEKEVQILNINDVLPNRFQPRITFDEKAIMELSESIKEHGVIQPIVVRRISDKYEIIAGERRYKASVLAGKTTIPAIVTDLNDKDSAEIALIENVQRRDLTPIEEAVSYKKILDMGYLNQTELATKLGKTQSTIANKLRLLNLTDEVQEALLKEKISERHARSLLKLDKDKQNMMLDRIITERMTVRKTDEEIAKITSNEEDGSQKQVDFVPRKEEPVMNDNLNNFNIPNVPIIEPSNPIMNKPLESTVEKEEPSTIGTINPGFMDINKIQSEAKDINSMDTVGLANLNIESSINNVEEPVIPGIPTSNIIEEPSQEPRPVGRFFTAPIDNSVDENSNSINDIFNQKPIDNPFKENIDNINNQVDENLSNTSINSQTNSIFEQPLNVEEQLNSTIPTIEPFNQTNNNDSMKSIYQQNSSMNTIPFMKTQQMESELFNPNQSVVEMGGTGIISEEPVLQPLMNNETSEVHHDIKEAIKIIRNCSNDLEKLGFKIDVEEMDFADYYQANFRIEKN